MPSWNNIKPWPQTQITSGQCADVWKKVAKRNSSKRLKRFRLGGAPLSTKTYALAIRLGKLVEFETGKTAIAVPSINKLPTVIDMRIAAVRNGELDAQLAVVSTKPHKKAAKK